jgi:hypothetical protein
MHGSLQLIMATESDRSRRAAAKQARLATSLRRRSPLTAITRRVVAAHGFPPRAAPGTESPSLGHTRAASLRGR